MTRLENAYYVKRPYRYRSTTGSFFLPLMEKRFIAPFSNQWEQFGYEIGGPVCYSYVRWLVHEIGQDTDITGLAFVARDGYLLQKIYQMLPISRDVITHYVFATRAVASLCETAKGKDAFCRYLAQLDFGDGHIGVVDTVTMKFSSQHLMETGFLGKTRGYFWTVLRSAQDYRGPLNCKTYQQEQYHLIRCWNLIEMIITSPEPPIEGIRNERAIYRIVSPQEAARESAFKEMEKGIMGFVRDVCASNDFPVIDSHEIAKWVNDYLKHPSAEDVKMFQTIAFAEDVNHNNYIPIDPFFRKTPWKAAKDRLWLLSQRHTILYAVLHGINSLGKGKEAI